jgi:hypothetical protein
MRCRLALMVRSAIDQVRRSVALWVRNIIRIRTLPFIATAGRISRKAARTSNTRSKLLASPRACGCLNPAFPQRCHLAAGIVLRLTKQA